MGMVSDMAMSKEERGCMISMGDAISAMSDNILKIGAIVTSSYADSVLADSSINTAAMAEQTEGRCLKQMESESCTISGLFIDGGTPKKQVQEAIKIPEDKYRTFVIKLMESTDGRHDGYTYSFVWDVIGATTRCKLSSNGHSYVGVATRHPDDTPNEYIGKSLSFNRAFDKLERAVNGVSHEKCIGYALNTAKQMGKVDVAARGGIYRSVAAEYITKGDMLEGAYGGDVRPLKSERSFYHGGRLEIHTDNDKKDTVNIDFECTYGCSPHEMSDIAQRIIGFCESETKSEDVSKESEESKESDDITITMSRKKASYVADAMEGGFNVNDVHRQILDAMRK